MADPDFKPCGRQGPRRIRRPARDRRRDAICIELREAYAAVMREPVPERFRGIFDRPDPPGLKKPS